MTFFIETFGCKVNQYESQVLKEYLIYKGFTYSTDMKNANVIIVNSCTVTSVSDRKVRHFLSRCKRLNPNCITVLTGCIPHTSNAILESPLVDITLGIGQYKDIYNMISKFLHDGKKIVSVIKHTPEEPFTKMSITEFSEHTRAFVKIEDGCNNFCNYCIIPYARGRVRSKSLGDLKQELECLANKGYKEIVLTGISLTSYGKDLQDTNLTDAIETAYKIKDIKRIRLGSLDPEFFTESIIKRLSGFDRLCPHFHLALQSGSDDTLKRMNRKYTTSEYRKVVDNIRKYFKNPSITTDVMVGFAGESEKEFQQSLNFVKEIGFAKIHVFPYSERVGTVGYKLPNKVDAQIKSERTAEMLDIARKSTEKFLSSQIGCLSNVLFERPYNKERENKSYFEGFSENYTPIIMPSEIDISGKIISTYPISATSSHCIAEKGDNI